MYYPILDGLSDKEQVKELQRYLKGYTERTVKRKVELRAEVTRLKEEALGLHATILNRHTRLKKLKDKLNDPTKILVPKESITQLREILATLKHWVTGNEGDKLINEAFEKHLGFTADGFKHFTPEAGR